MIPHCLCATRVRRTSMLSTGRHRDRLPIQPRILRLSDGRGAKRDTLSMVGDMVTRELSPSITTISFTGRLVLVDIERQRVKLVLCPTFRLTFKWRALPWD